MAGSAFDFVVVMEMCFQFKEERGWIDLGDGDLGFSHSLDLLPSQEKELCFVDEEIWGKKQYNFIEVGTRG